MVSDEKEYFICFIDALGFEDLPKEMIKAYDLGVEPSDIRYKFISNLDEKLNDLLQKKYIVGKNDGTDDWIFVSDDLQNLIISVSEIMEMYSVFPFEIGLGSGIYKEDVNFNSKQFISQDPTIQFLKTKILPKYSKWYKSAHDEKSVKDTYVLFTKELHQKLDYFEQDIFELIKYERETLYLIDDEKFKTWGKCLNFLNTLGISKNKIYDGVDRLYAIPQGYDEIKKHLKSDKVVIITDNPESGKTYTAVRLLWEYYLKGYQPVWERGDNSIHEKRISLENIESNLKKKQIFYFEDPFGENKYEKMELLEKKIGSIIDKIREFNDVYLIITSRREIFKEFNLNNLYLADFERFEQSLNMTNCLLDCSERQKLLLMWAKKNKCKWLTRLEIKTDVLELLESSRCLPSPLKIREFCVASRDTVDYEEIHKKIIEKSKETSIGFAEEISHFSADKILFLSFPFTSGSFELEFIKESYKEMVHEFGLEDAWNFALVFKWFKDDKIEVFNNKNKIRFSHPAYLESLKYLLMENKGCTGIFPEIFSKFLWKLAENDNSAAYVARVIADNYEYLPEDVHSLLFTLAKKDKTKASVVRTLIYNYSTLPENVQSLVLDLYSSSEIKPEIARAITDYFNVVPKNVQFLLFEMADDDRVAGHLVRAVIDNYNHLPEDVKNLIFYVYGKEKFDKEIARATIENYLSLPDYIKCLLFNIAEKEEAKIYVAKAVADKSENLPNDVIEYLLTKLCKDEKCDKFVAKAIIRNFDSLPEKLRNLLYKYVECSPDLEYIAQSVEGNFEKLPGDVLIRILSKLANEDVTVKHTVRILINNYDVSPPELHVLLHKLLNTNKKAHGYASNYIMRKPERISSVLHDELK